MQELLLHVVSNRLKIQTELDDLKAEQQHPHNLIEMGKKFDAMKEQRDKMLNFLKEIADALKDKSKLSIWEISVLKEAKEIIDDLPFL